jgi:uncharacterized protein YkwD
MSRACGVSALLLALAALPARADDKKDEPALSEDEQALIDLTNAERAKADKGLKPLKANPKLMAAARQHAENMAAQDKLAHVLDGKTPSERVKAAGYKYRATGENILWNGTTPKETVAAWMDSPQHRENILKPGYTETGVGVAKNKKGEPYWVQVFGRR